MILIANCTNEPTFLLHFCQSRDIASLVIVAELGHELVVRCLRWKQSASKIDHLGGDLDDNYHGIDIFVGGSFPPLELISKTSVDLNMTSSGYQRTSMFPQTLTPSEYELE
jgi:hypothetical protein